MQVESSMPDAAVWFRTRVRQRLQVQMIGRERERAELAAGLDNAVAGRGSVMLLVGEAGMGKSTLARWTIAQAAEAGVTVGQGACSAAGMPALWPLRRALADIVPDLRWGADAAATTSSDRDLLAATVVEAIATAARNRPLLLLVEDLHWADPVCLLMIRAIVDAVPALSVVLLLTTRDDPGEPPTEVRAQLADLPTHARRIVLPPLDEAGVAVLARQTLRHDMAERDVRDLHRRTGGNPFFVQEVLRLRAAHGDQAALVVPPGVSEVIQRRVARVSQGCAALLALAAVAAAAYGDVIEHDLVADDPNTAVLLVEAVSAGLLDATHPDHVFRHALIREVVEAGLSAPQRARLHALVATRLERRGDTRSSSARLAYHWSRAEGALAAERAAFWSLRAAHSAVEEFGFETAVEHFRHALTAAGTDRVAVSIELGEALQLCGQTNAAHEVLVAAAHEAELAERPVELARAALALGGGLAGFEVPITDESQSTLLARADQVLPTSERAWRAAVRGRLSLARAGAMTPSDRVAMAADAVRLAGEAGDPAVESAVLAAYCDAIAGPDFVLERIAAADRIVALTESRDSLHDQTTTLLARRLLLVARLENGDLGAAETCALAYEQIASRLGIPLYGWLPEIWRGMRALLVGDVDAALRHADAAEQIEQRAQSFNAELMVFTLRLQAYLDRGTPYEFAPAVRGILDQLGPLGMPAMYLAAPARLLLAAGDPSAARSVLRVFASGDPAAMPKDAEWLEAHWALADIAIELDDRAVAERLYDTLLPYVHLWAVDGIGGAVFGAVTEQLGRLAEYLGRGVDAERLLAQARGQYERQSTPALLRRLSRGAATGTARIHRDGVIWQLEWRGRRTTVPDAKGLHDLATLLTRPGQPIPARQLVAAPGGPPSEPLGGGLGPVLDDRARRAYRHRLDELETELHDAEANADLARAERLRDERAIIADELAAAMGLGGRARIAGDPTDRARKAVTMRIRAAIRSIEGQDPALARHLTNSVRTGRLCSYQPEGPVRWRT